MGTFRTTVEKDFDAAPPVVFQAFIRAMEAVPRMGVVRSDHATGVIEATTKMSWMSWGENVRVNLQESDPGRTRASVSSSLKMQLVDWGRNKRNVERLFGAVLAELRSGARPGPVSDVPPLPPPPPPT